ncbi:hypothetical protein IC582_028211 [Cucumis melo]
MVQGQIHLSVGAVLSFGLAHYASSEFELIAEELLMSNSVIKASSSSFCFPSIESYILAKNYSLDFLKSVFHMRPRLYCELSDCPAELLHPLKIICRVEDLTVEGTITGSVIHFHWVRDIFVYLSGAISASGLGCTGEVGRGRIFANGLGAGGGHGGKGGDGYYNGTFINGGVAYGDPNLPCELGSGSGNGSLAGETAGGGIIVNF